MKEALKLALEALEGFIPYLPLKDEAQCNRYDKAITAIKEALAQPEQEPVAYIRVSKTGNVMACAKTGDFYKLPDKTFLYTSPQPARVQEPVAWMFQHEETGRTVCIDAQQLGWGFEKGNPRLKKIAPLYTTPPQRKPLTNDAARKLWSHIEGVTVSEAVTFLSVVRATESAHNIKG